VVSLAGSCFELRWKRLTLGKAFGDVLVILIANLIWVAVSGAVGAGLIPAPKNAFVAIVASTLVILGTFAFVWRRRWNFLATSPALGLILGLPLVVVVAAAFGAIALLGMSSLVLYETGQTCLVQMNLGVQAVLAIAVATPVLAMSLRTVREAFEPAASQLGGTGCAASAVLALLLAMASLWALATLGPTVLAERWPVDLRCGT
jgi:hypothetical protein